MRVVFKKRKKEKKRQAMSYKPRIVQDTAWKQKLNHALSTVPGAIPGSLSRRTFRVGDLSQAE